MKITTLICSSAFLLLASATVLAATEIKEPSWGAWKNDPYALEPCINGAVSATGLYPSQKAEFAALELKADTKRKATNAPSSTIGKVLE